MAADKLRLTCSKVLLNYKTNFSYNLQPKLFYCTNKGSDEESSKTVGRFAEFYKKEIELQENISTPPELTKQSETFASLLRHSKFIDLGDPAGKEVIGQIYHVVGDDLYIDFGWKFPTVCTAPRNNRQYYVKGAKVKLLIKELELSTKFLGSNVETTLLEADCVLLGLASEKKKIKRALKFIPNLIRHRSRVHWASESMNEGESEYSGTPWESEYALGIVSEDLRTELHNLSDQNYFFLNLSADSLKGILPTDRIFKALKCD